MCAETAGVTSDSRRGHRNDGRRQKDRQGLTRCWAQRFEGASKRSDASLTEICEIRRSQPHFKGVCRPRSFTRRLFPRPDRWPRQRQEPPESRQEHFPVAEHRARSLLNRVNKSKAPAQPGSRPSPSSAQPKHRRTRSPCGRHPARTVRRKFHEGANERNVEIRIRCRLRQTAIIPPGPPRDIERIPKPSGQAMLQHDSAKALPPGSAPRAINRKHRCGACLQRHFSGWEPVRCTGAAEGSTPPTGGADIEAWIGLFVMCFFS